MSDDAVCPDDLTAEEYWQPKAAASATVPHAASAEISNSRGCLRLNLDHRWLRVNRSSCDLSA